MIFLNLLLFLCVRMKTSKFLIHENLSNKNLKLRLIFLQVLEGQIIDLFTFIFDWAEILNDFYFPFCD